MGSMILAWMMFGIWTAGWSPAENPLLTRWATNLVPDQVWPEYPRPQMVRKEWLNLNGLWRYAVCPKDQGRPDQWDGQILVPFALESALSGVRRPLRPDQRLWYLRTFEIPKDWDGRRILLHFGAVDWQCTVWVNGRQVGEHTGGYDPFTFDITDARNVGHNELVVAVWDPTDTGYQPRGKQVLKPGGIWYTAVSGIWQTVWLEPVAADYIQSLSVVPDLDKGMVAVQVQTRADAQADVKVSYGQQVVAQASGPASKVIQLQIKDAKAWSPDQPNLYDLEVSLVRNGMIVDTVTSYFGIRKIEVRKDPTGIPRIYLNNQILFQFGPLDQGWWPDGLYTAPSDEAMAYDLQMTKRFGMNMVRKHVKVEPAPWYHWCDRLGLLVWQDMPSGDSGRDNQSKANFRRELKAVIDALRHFPCIVMWVPFNEGWGQHDTVQIAKWIQDYDPTRLVNEASGWNDHGSGHVSDMHSYPGPDMRAIERERACVLGEFGGLGMPIPGHTWQTEKNWGYVTFKTAADLTDAYVDLLAQLRPLIANGLCAAVYTQTTDVEVEVNGLLTYDRAVVKMDLERIAKAAEGLYLPVPGLDIILPTSQIQGHPWRYTTDRPTEDWYRPDFDDRAWRVGQGGFGTHGTPGALVRTVWNSSEIWLRRQFSLDTVPEQAQLVLLIHHDEDAQVYINGQLVKTLKGFVRNYGPVVLGPDAISLLKAGQNTIAVYCHQTTGGQYIDVGLAVMIDQ